jgi:uncharacterized protein YcfL
MKDILLVILCLLVLTISLTGCDEVREVDIDEEAQHLLREQIKKDITVNLEFQHFNESGKQKVVIWIENNGEYTFNGTLNISIYTLDGGEVRGTNTYLIENLEAQSRTYATMLLRPNTGSTGRGRYRWNDVSFKQSQKSTEEEIIPVE